MIDHFDKEYAFLSNFYPTIITENYEDVEIIYPTVEHAYQAGKTLDLKTKIAISNLSSPGAAKSMGRKITLRSGWERSKVSFMKLLIYKKFEDPELREQLLNTEDEWLVEGNFWHDNFWGNCQCSKCENIIGRNQLGHILMEVRNKIKK